MIKGWQDDPVQRRIRTHATRDQAHRSAAVEDFETVLRRQAARNLIDIYLYEHRPLWRRIDYLGITVRVAALGVATAIWAVAVMSVAAVFGLG